MRNLSSVSAVLATLCFLASCSPKIASNIQKSYPARAEGAPVLVYELAETLPDQAETLGDLTITDAGVSAGSNYDRIISSAKKFTNHIGGNALQLTMYTQPSASGSMNHLVSANMLLVPDSAFSSGLALNATLGDTPLRRNTTPLPVTLIVNAGYAFITSKMYEMPSELKTGLDINVAFQWVGKKGLGFGLRYSGYFAGNKSFDNHKIQIHYFAPEFVMRQNINRWTFRESVSLGIVSYTEKVNTFIYGNNTSSASISGLGFHVDLGAEYRVSKHIGVGASIGAYNARFGSMDDMVEQYDEDRKAGIARISLNGGMRFYF